MSSRRSSAKSSAHVEAAAPPRQMLTLFDGISTIVSLMVGSGIFSTAGQIQASVGSSGLSLLLWGITGVLALTGALCYAELGTMIPGSGGEAQYLAQGLGPLMVFLFNWTSILLLKPGTVAILASATSSYLLEMTLELFAIGTGLSDSHKGWIIKGGAIAVCIIVTLASALSTKWSNRIQSVLTLGKIGALALIIFSGVYYAIFVDSSAVKNNLGSPFANSQFAFGKLALALTSGLWAFEGWNNLNIVAGSLANPKVNLPLSIWISMVAVLTLYIMTLLGYYAVLPMAAITASAETIGVTFGQTVFGKVGNVIMPFLIASSTFGSALSSMVTSSEIIVLAALTGQMPRYYAKISPTFDTAARAYWQQGLLAIVLVLLSDFSGLITIYTFPTWIFYSACVVVLLKLRWTAPKLERPYRVWVTTPFLFLAASLFLQATSLWGEPILVSASLGTVLLGIPIYYLFGLHKAPGTPLLDKPAEGGEEMKEKSPAASVDKIDKD